MVNPQRRLLTRTALLANGFTDGEILQDRRSGRLSSLRPGAYLLGVEPDPAERHRLLLRAQVPRLGGTPVVSHLSAAADFRMDLWNVNLDPIHVNRAKAGTARTRPTLVTHLAPLADEDIVEREGLLMTSAARTVIDCARTLAFESAVVLADSALRAGLVTPEELAEALDRQRRLPGLRSARRVIRFADGRSMSVGESRSRVMIALSGLPRPDLQHDMYDETGFRFATADFYWKKYRTVGEFDGKGKYVDYLKPGESPADVVFREKRREDALRDQGCGVVRWDWADLAQPRRTVGRIARTLGLDL